MTTVATDPATSVAEDALIIRRIGNGDRDALAELYARHAGWLTTRLQRRCGNPELVDTALQDTFLAVWKQADRYEPTGDVGAWLWTIANGSVPRNCSLIITIRATQKVLMS